MKTKRIASTAGILAATALVAGAVAAAAPANACITTEGTNVTVVNTTDRAIQVKPAGSADKPTKLEVNESTKYRVDRDHTMKLTVSKSVPFANISYDLTIHGSSSVWEANVSQSIEHRSAQTVDGYVTNAQGIGPKSSTTLTSPKIGAKSDVSINETTRDYERDISWKLRAMPI